MESALGDCWVNSFKFSHQILIEIIGKCSWSFLGKFLQVPSSNFARNPWKNVPGAPWASSLKFPQQACIGMNGNALGTSRINTFRLRYDILSGKL